MPKRPKPWVHRTVQNNPRSENFNGDASPVAWQSLLSSGSAWAPTSHYLRIYRLDCFCWERFLFDLSPPINSGIKCDQSPRTKRRCLGRNLKKKLRLAPDKLTCSWLINSESRLSLQMELSSWIGSGVQESGCRPLKETTPARPSYFQFRRDLSQTFSKTPWLYPCQLCFLYGTHLQLVIPSVISISN